MNNKHVMTSQNSSRTSCHAFINKLFNELFNPLFNKPLCISHEQVMNKQWDKQYAKLEQVRESFAQTVYGTRTVFEQLLANPNLFKTAQVPPRAFAHRCASSKYLNRLNVSGLSTDPARVQHQ